MPRRSLLTLATRFFLGVVNVAILLIFGGTFAFKTGSVKESLQLFDAAASIGFPSSLLWQRGISLYYSERFADGAAQFRKDTEVNSADTEEAVWAMLCDARELGFKAARKQIQVVGEDPRPVMQRVYSLFAGGLGEAAARADLERTATAGSGGEAFYAALYLGLFCEAQGDAAASRRWIKLAVDSEYGRGSWDYMADVARVHARQRGWN